VPRGQPPRRLYLGAPEPGDKQEGAWPRCRLAVAFLHMMFAHAEFEEQVRVLQASIMKTPANRPHFLARLLRLSLGAKKTTATLGIRATVQNAWRI